MRDASTTIAPAIALVRPADRAGLPVAPATRRRLVGAALAAGDLATITIVVGLVQLVGPLVGFPAAEGPLALWICWTFASVAAHAMFGLDSSAHADPVERLRRRGFANLCAATLMIVLIEGGPLAPHAEAADIVLGTLVAIPLGHYLDGLIRGLLLRRGLWTAATVLYGSMASCAALARDLEMRPELGFRPIAVLADGEAHLAEPGYVAGLPVISSAQADIASLCIEVALCASGDLNADKAAWLEKLPLRQIFVVHDAAVRQTLNLRTCAMGGLLGLELRCAIHQPRNLRLKRMMDLALAIPASVLLLPIIVMLAFAVMLSGSGPVLYAQQRIGLNGRVFRVYKFRTMYADAEARLAQHLESDPAARREWERFFKLQDDPRILPVIGHFLRRSSLDELPQLWNILRGDMSIVGPRPFPAYHSECFDPAFQALRVSVPPGLTGLWQVSDRSDGDLVAQQRQDSFYIHNWSFWLDLYVLLQTLPAVLSARGAR
ncbi:MAG: exopolysaccharide biosynthesis polyprenyl glycosylphosphotransferase [Chelatococcus sp.]|nr:MAG: exopolysaccharide biosynthesis polyprenyl glycosylphosphotransferase [Chelatococcus sp.]